MLIPFLNVRIIRRQSENKMGQVLPILIALVVAIVISALLIWISGANVKVALSALFQGAFGGKRQLAETINKTTPILLCGLAAVIAFRAKIWNIGVEGQFLAGAIGAYWAIMTFRWLPTPLLILVTLLFSFLAGAMIGLLAGFLKTRFNIDVIISTVMLNYIVAYFLSMLIDTVYHDPSVFFKQSPYIPESGEFPMIFTGYRLHAGVMVAILVAIIIYFLIERSPLGYDIQVLGHNPIAAKFKGINVTKTILLVMLISGGVAGLAGGGELAGLSHRLKLDLSPGYGSMGIIVAMLAGLRPSWTILTSFLFGALLTGSLKMQIVANVPVALVYAIQAIILLLVISAEFFASYEIQRERYAHTVIPDSNPN